MLLTSYVHVNFISAIKLLKLFLCIGHVNISLQLHRDPPICFSYIHQFTVNTRYMLDIPPSFWEAILCGPYCMFCIYISYCCRVWVFFLLFLQCIVLLQFCCFFHLFSFDWYFRNYLFNYVLIALIRIRNLRYFKFVIVRLYIYFVELRSNSSSGFLFALIVQFPAPTDGLYVAGIVIMIGREIFVCMIVFL